MATTGIADGTLYGLYKDVSGTLTKIAGLTSNDFDLSIDTLETSNKDGAGWATFIAGKKNATINFEGFFQENGSTSAISFEELYIDAVAGTTLTIAYSSQVTGDIKYTVSCLVSNLKKSDPYNDISKFSGTLQITGQPTKAAVS